jgi:ribosome biogenesis ATPase
MREGIYLIAATNRPDMIDEAMLRPGRLETLLYVALPGPEERVEILKALIGQRGGIVDKELAAVGRLGCCESFSGADLESLLRRAGQHAMRRRSERVEESDFLEAAKTVRPSVGDVGRYEGLRGRFETKLF